MIAEVIPLIRLPRRFTFFDYEISNANVGDIVSIKFKGRQTFGVTRSLKNDSQHNAQKINGIIKKNFLTSDDIKRLELIATNIAQSPSSIFYTALFGLRTKDDSTLFETIDYPKLTLNRKTAEQILQTIKALINNTEIFCQISQEGALTLAYALSRQFKNQILIIAPHERDAKVIHRLINFKRKTATLHGKTAHADRNATIQGWKSGKINILISTRQGSLLPAKKIDAILLLDANSLDHKNWDRNPRYDARLAAKLLAKQHNAKLILTDSIPTTKDFLEKKPIVSIDDKAITWPQIINLSAPEESSGAPMISESLKSKIKIVTSQNKSVLLFYNRKGVAKRLQRSNCKHIPFCGTCGANPVVRAEDLICPVCKTEMWIPNKCPACGSDKLKPRGVGNERIMAELRKEFPNQKISVIDKQNIGDLKADILIVTEYYFQAIHLPFTKKRFGLIADLCADLGLGSDFNSAENTACKLWRLIMLANQQMAACYIQTWIPQVIEPMFKTNKFLQSELIIREKYRLFPVFEKITKRCPGNNSQDVVCSSTINFDEKKALTSVPNSCIIDTELRNYES